MGVIDNISSSKESLSTSNNQNENEIECKSALNQNSNQIENKSSENLERNENSNFASDDGIKLQDPVGAPPDISPPPQNNSELRELDNNNNSNNSGQNLNDYQFATSPEKIDIKITTENEEKADISSQESYERNKNENRDDNEDDNINENKDENRDDNEDDNINENRDENINNDDENINNNENSENKMMNAHGNEHHKKPKEDSPRTQFRKMFYGTNNPNQRRAKTSFKPRRHFTDDVTVSQETVEKMADGILKGKSCKMTNPFDVAEVIDELNSRRIDALANNDYRQSKNIKDSIDNIRSNFRQRDRELLHKEIVSKLEVRNQESIEILEETKEKYLFPLISEFLVGFF
ncbi:hypothetical protein TRFO_20508 [Tritrichomonas foetus]|uniref:Uncharacterized protein n=1 Tax=Tritrichomonas foetus TaxID=1144522 RepID=A0A1J4KFN4_9EUKA|nr:hypothetical protein TRFO_20508 [Tritrichomonas foetus]|eukprot:OHT10217.1 hypothetical protein TRFO_20508 [Tritrichomonas foetus]